jgi:acyl transferase domain-containing protein
MRGTGTMLAASVGGERAKKFEDESDGSVVVAAYNSAKSVTFAGPKNKLEEIAAKLKEEGVFARMSNVDIPFHSPVLGAIKQECITISHPHLIPFI